MYFLLKQSLLRGHVSFQGCILIHDVIVQKQTWRRKDTESTAGRLSLWFIMIDSSYSWWIPKNGSNPANPTILNQSSSYPNHWRLQAKKKHPASWQIVKLNSSFLWSLFPPPQKKTRLTPPKTNMEPEFTILKKEIPIGNHHFQVLC